jgi:hypothetical protein
VKNQEILKMKNNLKPVATYSNPDLQKDQIYFENRHLFAALPAGSAHHAGSGQGLKFSLDF